MERSALFVIMIAAICLGQQSSAGQAASAGKIDTILHQAAHSSMATSSRFDLITPALFDSFLIVLSHQGIVIKKNTVAAMGFSHDSTDTDTTKSLFIISLDESGQPQKHSYKIQCEVKKAPVVAPAPEKKSQNLTEQTKLRQDGRVYFMLNCAVKSLYVYPMGLNFAFTNTSARVVTGVSFLALGASLYGSYMFTKKMELGYGRVEMMNFGGDLGVAYPLLLAGFCENSFGIRDANQFRGWGMMLGFPLGIFAGSYAKFAGNFEYGDASIMTNTSKFGFLYGFLIPLYFCDIWSSEYLSLSTGLTMALIPAGLYVGNLLVGDRHYSSGRSAFITTSAIMGALTGALIPTLWEDKNKEVYATTALLGHVLGTLYGFTYMGDRSYTFGQGMFMAASAAVGTAVAEAIPFISQTDFIRNHQAYTAAGFVGSWGGLMLGEVLARALFEKSGRDNAKTASVSFPGLWQVPLIWALSKNEVKGVATGNVPLVEVTF